jgi:NADH:ubiquinone oxidoreductase subunit H
VLNSHYGVKVQCVRKVAVHLDYGTYIWLSVSKMPLMCGVVSLYSAVKQRLKFNFGKVFNCLIQFLLTMVLSIEERV